MGQSRFTIIPTAAINDDRLTAVQLRVLLAIGSYSSKDRAAFPRQQTIADSLGIARETVNRSVKKLREYGYVHVQVQFRDDGSQKENLYWVKLDPCDPSVTPPVTKLDHTGCDRTGSHLRTDNKNSYTDTNVSVLPTSPEQAVQKGSGRVRGPARGSRIAPDWTPSLKDYAFANQAGLSREEINREADRFRDYWIAASGRNAVKLDWSATWRNWIRSDYRKPKASQHRGGAEQTLSAFDRVAARMAGNAGRTASETRSDADTIDGEYWPVDEGAGPG